MPHQPVESAQAIGLFDGLVKRERQVDVGRSQRDGEIGQRLPDGPGIHLGIGPAVGPGDERGLLMRWQCCHNGWQFFLG